MENSNNKKNSSIEQESLARTDQYQDKFYDILKDTMPNPIYFQDTKGILQDCNKAFENYFSIKRDTIIGKSIYHIVPGKFSNELKEKDNLLLQNNLQTQSHESIISEESNIIKMAIINKTVIFEENNSKAGIFGVIQDITDLKKKELELKKMIMVVEHSPASIIITDTTGKIEYVNPKFTELTGYSKDEIYGQNPRLLKSGEQSESFYKNMWETLTQGQIWQGDFHNKKRNGESYWERASISSIKNEKGEIYKYIAIKEDITENKLAEEALKISEETLRKRNFIIEQDLRIARIAQKELLLTNIPEMNFISIDYRYNPMEDVGGDYFAIVPFDKNKVGVFICDISGHGVAAALFVALIKFSSEKLYPEYGDSPGQYLKMLNQSLQGFLSSYFITGIYGIFESNKNGEVSFTYSNGGHPLPIILRDGGTVEMLKNKNTIIGIFDDINYTQSTIRLNKGDKMFLYTDGIPETENNKKEIIGFDDNLSELFLQSSNKNLGYTLDTIINKVNKFRNKVPAEDDIILLGFEIK